MPEVQKLARAALGGATARKQNAIVVFSKPPRISRTNQNEPYATLPWEDLDALFTSLLGDILEQACRLKDVDVFLHRKRTELSDDFLLPFRDRVKLVDDPGGSFTDSIHHALDHAFGGRYNRVIVLLDNHPHMDAPFLARVVQQLAYEDDCMVVAPSIEGTCFLLGMKMNHGSLFEKADQDTLVKPDLLMKRLCRLDSMLFLTEPFHSLNSGFSLARLKGELDAADGSTPEFPRRTYEMFRTFDRKYRPKKITR
jgi:glycosyltransferase A (GT-A) superfamily protein (DUF2064 family)